jgi:hypothetical protein
MGGVDGQSGLPAWRLVAAPLMVQIFLWVQSREAGGRLEPREDPQVPGVGRRLPIDDYLPVLDPFPTGMDLNWCWPETTRGNVESMARDDDIDYTILALHILEVNNAALMAAALLWGDGDYSRTVGLAVQGGWDTDCNGATAGSAFGAMHGTDLLPSRWVDPLNDMFRSAIMGFDNSMLSDLATRTPRLALVSGPSLSV